MCYLSLLWVFFWCLWTVISKSFLREDAWREIVDTTCQPGSSQEPETRSGVLPSPRLRFRAYWRDYGLATGGREVYWMPWAQLVSTGMLRSLLKSKWDWAVCMLLEALSSTEDNTNCEQEKPLYLLPCNVSLSHVWLFVTLWTIVCLVPLSMGLLRQEYWSGLPCPSLGDLPNSGIEPGSPALQVDSLLSEPMGSPVSL